jgi:acyl-CoA dehydrogenase
MDFDYSDKAQVHGGMGVAEDTPLAGVFAAARYLRLADGPDEVHLLQLGKLVGGMHAAPAAP